MISVLCKFLRFLSVCFRCGENMYSLEYLATHYTPLDANGNEIEEEIKDFDMEALGL